ncbi:hypothetical protein [Anatilimnocola floriformis]|uniref:hypothetical protein n=1 Tax=Anatilimnocola floriformis TaxID=2948575 RepID=UPI0020C3F49B|nr:hypothetical protein [Anatilimnocola floriformis]
MSTLRFVPVIGKEPFDRSSRDAADLLELTALHDAPHSGHDQLYVLRTLFAASETLLKLHEVRLDC